MDQERKAAVERMKKYIEEHLTEPITLYQLAQAAGYSPYYSAKIFKRTTGIAPFDYIRRYRLSQSALKLLDEKVRVVDVAMDFVFDSHEGFTRAFIKEFGTTPKQFARYPLPLKLFLPSKPEPQHHLSYDDKSIHSAQAQERRLQMNNTNAIFVQIMERPARKLIIKRGKTAKEYFEYCEEVGCDVWGVISRVKEALYEPVGMWMPDNMRPQGTSYYTQGVEVPADYNGEVPEGYELMDLPPCKMLIFQGQPFDDEKFSEAIGELWKQIENFNPEIYGYEWADEMAPKIQLAPMGYRGYIEGRPVREIGSNSKRCL